MTHHFVRHEKPFRPWLFALVARHLGYEPDEVTSIRMHAGKAVVVHIEHDRPVITQHNAPEEEA